MDIIKTSIYNPIPYLHDKFGEALNNLELSFTFLKFLEKIAFKLILQNSIITPNSFFVSTYKLKLL